MRSEQLKTLVLVALAWTLALATGALAIVGAWSAPRLAGLFVGLESFLLVAFLILIAREARRS